MNLNIRRVYLYVTSFIGLVLIIVGAVGLVNLGLKTWILTKADTTDLRYICERPVLPVESGERGVEQISDEECEQRQADERSARRQSDAARNISLIVVGLPVWLYHWGKVKNNTSN